jgi:hypothetical protein
MSHAIKIIETDKHIPYLITSWLTPYRFIKYNFVNKVQYSQNENLREKLVIHVSISNGRNDDVRIQNYSTCRMMFICNLRRWLKDKNWKLSKSRLPEFSQSQHIWNICYPIHSPRKRTKHGTFSQPRHMVSSLVMLRHFIEPKCNTKLLKKANQGWIGPHVRDKDYDISPLSLWLFFFSVFEKFILSHHVNLRKVLFVPREIFFITHTF